MPDRNMLQFDYEKVSERTITAALGLSDGSKGWWSISLVLGQDALLLDVDPDTDEISVSFGSAPEEGTDWVPVAALRYAIGSSLGWCWVGRNYLGYLDMFTLSFNGLEPQVCFVGQASGLTIRAIAPVT